MATRETEEVDAALRFWGEHVDLWKFAHHCQTLSEPVIRAVLDRLLTKPRLGPVVFLHEAVRLGDSSLAVAWRDALVTVLALNTSYAWGSKQRRAKIVGVAEGPLLGAVQAAVVAGIGHRLDWLAVLAHDASEASVDALASHVARGLGDEAASLAFADALRRYAHTPDVLALLEVTQQKKQSREAQSPALTFARALGFDVARFKVELRFSSTVLERHEVPEFQGSLRFRSDQACWFDVHLTDSASRRTLWNSDTVHNDELSLGTCTPEQFPTWLAAAERKLKVQFTDPPMLSGLRGQKATHFIDWLFSEVRKQR